MKRKTMGWLIVFLLFIVYMLNYMDRSALSITAPLIEKELGFNAAEMGMIFSAFFIGYALFNFIGGWASDKVGPKTVFLIAALLWSVFCGLTGLVTGLWTMLIVRVLFGMAEGPVSAAGNKIINNWISRKESNQGRCTKLAKSLSGDDDSNDKRRTAHLADIKRQYRHHSRCTGGVKADKQENRQNTPLVERGDSFAVGVLIDISIHL